MVSFFPFSKALNDYTKKESEIKKVDKLFQDKRNLMFSFVFFSSKYLKRRVRCQVFRNEGKGKERKGREGGNTLKKK